MFILSRTSITTSTGPGASAYWSPTATTSAGSPTATTSTSPSASSTSSRLSRLLHPSAYVPPPPWILLWFWTWLLFCAKGLVCAFWFFLFFILFFSPPSTLHFQSRLFFMNMYFSLFPNIQKQHFRLLVADLEKVIWLKRHTRSNKIIGKQKNTFELPIFVFSQVNWSMISTRHIKLNWTWSCSWIWLFPIAIRENTQDFVI